jgi:DNA-binding response OmpR family regulator
MTDIRLLLVEDDATSAAFLEQALGALPAEVDVAGDIAQAKKLAASTSHALWLVDAHLPDGDGLDCLRALRSVAQAPALAITAGAAREELDALCAGGFLEVLLKPVTMSMLLATVTRLLGMPGANSQAARTPLHFGKLPAWDDERALAAIGGNAAALEKLRRMFLLELMDQRQELGAAQQRGDAAAVRALVHKLRASCGFVGAARLAQAVESLHAAPLEPLSLRDFDFAADDTMSAQR